MRELYGFVCKKLVSTADFFCCFKLATKLEAKDVC